MNLNREFLLNVIWLLGVNLLIKPVFIFGVDRGVQNAVGEAEYGRYFALLSLAFMWQIVADFGIQQFNANHISRHNVLLPKYLPRLLQLKALLALLFAALVFGLGNLMPAGQEGHSVLWGIIVAQIGVSLVFYLRSNIAGLGMYRTDSLLSVLDRILAIFICGLPLLLWPLQYEIEWFAWGQALAVWISVLVAGFVVFSRVKPLVWRRQPQLMWLLLRKSFPYAIVVLLMSIYSRLDAVWLDLFLPDGTKEVGVYAAAFRLIEASNMLGYLFATLLLPMFARLLQQGGPAAVQPLFHLSFRLIMSISLSLAFAVCTFRQPWMQSLYTAADAQYGSLLGILIWVNVAVCGVYIYSSLLTVAEAFKALWYISGVGICINFTLAWFLIPSYGVLGAGIASLSTQMAMLIAQIWVVHRKYAFSFDGVFWWRLPVYIALLFGCMYAMPALTAWLFWPYAFVTMGMLGMICAFLLGWLPWQSIKSAFSSK